MIQSSSKDKKFVMGIFMDLQKEFDTVNIDIEEGIKVNGKLLRDVRFAGDQGMVAGSERGLQKMMDSLNATAEKYGMRINMKKTKVMKVSRRTGDKINIVINGNEIE